MIKIAHLYYDLMNLYGDNGNIKTLKLNLEKQGIKTTIEFLTIGDKIDFNEYDVIYIGPGTWNNEKMVLKDLMKYKKEIKKAIEDNKFFLIIGNALELFGKYIIDDSKKIETLDAFNFYTEKTDKRLVDEVYAKCAELNDYILGFKNQDGIIKSEEKCFFNIIKGIGFDENAKEEGIFINNFLGTYLIGPILVRNPELLEYLIRKIVLTKLPDFKFKDFDFELEKKAHDEYLKIYFNENTN